MAKRQSLVQRSVAGAAVAIMAASWALSAVPALADDSPPSNFPSWAEVEHTKADAAATAEQAGRISQLIGTLESQAGALGDAAVQAGAQYATVQQKLEDASAQVALLGAQAQRASDQALVHRQEAVAVAVESYKNGGTSLGIFSTIADLESTGSLNGVDMLAKIGERAAAKMTMATESQAAVAQLQQTRQAAQAVYAQLTEQAERAKDGAVAAQNQLNDQIQSQQGHSDTLMAQLAYLNDTTVAKEREYRQGQTALADYARAQEAKRIAEEATQSALTQERQATEAARNQAPAPQAAPIPKPVALPKPAPAAGTSTPAQPPAPKPAPAPVPEGPAPAPAPTPAPEPAPIVPAPPPANSGGSGSLNPAIPGGAVNDPAGAQAYASAALGSFGWGQDQFSCLVQLWERESNWRTNATNPSSGAYGIAQSLPASNYAQAGADWLTNYRTQVNWGLGYIQDRYGSPCGAWAHSQSVGWY